MPFGKGGCIDDPFGHHGQYPLRLQQFEQIFELPAGLSKVFGNFAAGDEIIALAPIVAVDSVKRIVKLDPVSVFAQHLRQQGSWAAAVIQAAGMWR